MSDYNEYTAELNSFQMNTYCFDQLKEHIILVEKLDNSLFRITWRLDIQQANNLKQALDVENHPERLIIKELN